MRFLRLIMAAALACASLGPAHAQARRGNIGADLVAKSPGDGYTLLMGAVSMHAINHALFVQSGAKMPFDPAKDFAPITLCAAVSNARNPRTADPRGRD